MGDCRLCGPESGFLRGLHRKCHSLQESGWDEMVEMATRTAESSGFSQAPLRLDLMAVPQRSFYDGAGINAAIAGGWHRAVSSSMADGILSLEKERLCDFRDQFSVQGGAAPGSRSSWVVATAPCWMPARHIQHGIFRSPGIGTDGSGLGPLADRTGRAVGPGLGGHG